MSATLKSLGLDRLTLDERIALAEELWASIAAEAKPGSFLTDAKREELDRRLADLDANPDDVVPWEQVKAEALARVARVRSGRSG
jgi:putative addiction module component (TIGR02574 family)